MRDLPWVRALLLLAATGCASTTLSGSDLRVPVLLGPVPCIGCGPQARSPAAMPVTRVAAEASESYLFIPTPGGPFRIGDASQPGVSPDRVFFGAPCDQDVQLSALRAHAWQVTIPLLYYRSDEAVEATATHMLVPGASCPSP
jgi:hypothetical protein